MNLLLLVGVGAAGYMVGRSRGRRGDLEELAAILGETPDRVIEFLAEHANAEERRKLTEWGFNRQ